jgi:hypothetical protein
MQCSNRSRNAIVAFEDDNRGLAEDGQMNGALIVSVKEEIDGHIQRLRQNPGTCRLGMNTVHCSNC